MSNTEQRAEPRCYFMEYRVRDYTLADAFRPNPNWGKKRFSVSAEFVGSTADEELIEAAQQSAPKDYVLARLWAVGPDGDRDIYVSDAPVNSAALTRATTS